MKRWPLLATGGAAALAVPLMVHDGYVIQLLNIAILNAIVVLGLNFVTGWTGQINFGQAAFYGLGAYTTAIATKAGLPWIATPFLSSIVVQPSQRGDPLTFTVRSVSRMSSSRPSSL